MGRDACSACSWMLRLRLLTARSPACESLSRLLLVLLAMLRRLAIPRVAMAARS